MPLNCPIHKEETHACLLCSNNRENYCWALCPPKENKKLITEILTDKERISILEARFENYKFLEDEYLKTQDLENRLIKLEELSYKIEVRINTLSEAESKFNTMYDTLNNTLTRFSNRLSKIEDSISRFRVLKYKYKD